MKPRFIIPALAATLATGGALLTLHAQDGRPPNIERNFDFKFNADPRLDPSQQSWEAQDSTPDQKQFRFEFRNDGSGPRFFKNGKEVKPAEGEAGADPMEQMRKEMEKEMEELLRKHMGEGGSGNSPFDDLFKKMQERQGQQPKAQQPRAPQGGQPDLDELFRRLRGQESGKRTVADGATRYSKHHRSVLAEWRPMAKVARESTVRIMKDSKQLAFATVVSADGYALTKASEVNKDGLEAEFHDGRIVPAKVVDKLESYDLALIKLDASGLTPVSFSASEAPIGTLVAAVGVDEDPLAAGVISIAARSLSDKGKGALGIRFKTEGADADKGVSIGGIIHNCPAERAGLREGDAILSINGADVEFPFQLQKVVAGMAPGDNVKLRYARDGKEEDIEFALTSREELMRIQLEEAKKQFGEDAIGNGRMLDPTARMGGSLSTNAGGYPNAVQSDLTIDANDCGGPVVDVDGRVIALAIARSERVSTYMIPGKVIQSLLVDVQNGKFKLAKDTDTLRNELREYESAVRKAQEALKAAEAGRVETEEALKKSGR
jgi:serine protease Do